MSKFLQFLSTEANHLQQAGLLYSEPILSSRQGPKVMVAGKELLNFASSDYLGLASHPDVEKAAIAAIERWGTGVAAVRLASGTMQLHVELEQALAKLIGAEQALLYPSGYHANTGLFESLLGDSDYLFLDEQIRPSLADGVRLCRARVHAYRHQDLNHLEDRLKRSRAARFRLIATDGVSALSGLSAPLPDIYALAAKYDAIVAVDDSEGVGVHGELGRGTHHLLGVNRIDIVTGSFGHALGGGAGGFIAGKKEVINWLRQKSRPHLISTALAPAAAAAALTSLEILRTKPELFERLRTNVRFFRTAVSERGFGLINTEHPAVAVLIKDAVVAQRQTDALYRKGVFAIGFCHPVVPEGAARIRMQVTARHTRTDLTAAADAFGESAATREIPIQKVASPS